MHRRRLRSAVRLLPRVSPLLAALAAALLLGGVLGHNPAQAQPQQAGPPMPPPEPEPDRSLDKPRDKPGQPPAAQRIEIRAQPLSDTDQRRRDPVAKTIYGRDELDKYGDTNLSDVLKRLPGVNMQGGNPRLRGLGAGYTLLLVNGEPAPPGFSLDNLSPGQVERIELTRGPSAEHSAQAVAGTLNIILREAPPVRQRELRLNTGYQADRPTVSANGHWGDRSGAFSYTLPAALYQWRGRADTRSQRQTLGTDNQPLRLDTTGDDSYWGHGFNFGPRLSWKLSDNDSLHWQSFAQRNHFNNAGRFQSEVLQGLAPISVDDRYASGGHWQMLRSGLQWQRRWADGARLEIKGGFQASSSRSHNRTDGLDRAGALTLERDTDNHNVERSLTTGGKLSQPLGEAHTLAMGWDLERRSRYEVRSVVENGSEQLQGYDGEPFEAELTRSALFVQDEWEIAPRWSSYVGLRAERIRISSQASQAGVLDRLHNSSQVVTPIWHLNHKLSATGRDLLRASLTRSYKAPELAALMARPSINTQSPATGPSAVTNPESSPDRIGNPALRPELATGLDLALEKYLPQGGVFSVGVFHRRISGLIRNEVRLQTVPWASVPRYVSQPINLAQARSTGIELELKGRGDELLAPLAALNAQPPWLKGLSLRGSFSVYRSTVDGIPGPDNRLEQQQPWSATAGFDQGLGPVLAGWLPALQTAPLTVGASLAWTPGYRAQQTPKQSLQTDQVRTLDAYALLAISRQATLRLAANNLLAEGSRSNSALLPDSGLPQTSLNSRSGRRSFNLSLLLKF